MLCVLAGGVFRGGEDDIRAEIAAGGGSRIGKIPRIWADLDALCGIGSEFLGELDGGGESQGETEPLGGGGMGLRLVADKMAAGSEDDLDRQVLRSRPMPLRPSSVPVEAHRADAQMQPAARPRGRERRRGWWWQRDAGRVVEEGLDFAQDTEEGGADEIEFIPDSDEDGGVDGSSADPFAGEFVPETEPQELSELLLVKPFVRDGEVHADNEHGDVLVKGEAAVVANKECDTFKDADAIIDHEVDPNAEEEDDLFKDGDFRGDSEVQKFEDFTLEWECQLQPFSVHYSWASWTTHQLSNLAECTLELSAIHFQLSSAIPLVHTQH
ncbi:hypothetical protein ACP4OV_016091 [Aristida adscensionis]